MILHYNGILYVHDWEKGYRYISEDEKLVVDVITSKPSEFEAEILNDYFPRVIFGAPRLKKEKINLERFQKVAGIQYFTEEELDLCKSNNLIWKRYKRVSQNTGETAIIMIKRFCNKEEFEDFRKVLALSWKYRNEIRSTFPLSNESPWIIDFHKISVTLSGILLVNKNFFQDVDKDFKFQGNIVSKTVFSEEFEGDEIFEYEEYFEKNLYNKPCSPNANKIGVYSECFEWLGPYGQIITYAFPIKWVFEKYYLNNSLNALAYSLHDSFLGDFFEITKIPRFKWSEKMYEKKPCLVGESLLINKNMDDYSQSLIKDILENEIQEHSVIKNYGQNLFVVNFENLSVTDKETSLLMKIKFFP